MADEKDELTDAEKDNFGGQPEGSEPTGYVANFDGDEIDGKRYKLGERIAADVDAGTIAYLVQNGRITPTTEGFSSPSGGEDSSIPSASEEPTLTAEQQAEADELVASSSKDDLLGTAEAEGVEGVTKDNNKSEIAAKIVAARSA